MRQAIFITGGGSGIGRATAEFFAAKGWFVGLADIDAAKLAETGALLPTGSWSSHVLDVRDRAGWDAALADFAHAAGDRLDILFNNAGIGTGGALEAMRADDIERVLDINLKGVFWGAQAGFPYLRRTAGSALVSTSSAAGIYASPGMSAYAATKFGVRAMTESLDREWRPLGIKARTIMPSFIDTPLLDATASGTNRQIRDVVRDAGLEFTPVEAVARAVWDAAHGRRVHTLVGRTAHRPPLRDALCAVAAAQDDRRRGVASKPSRGALPSAVEAFATVTGSRLRSNMPLDCAREGWDVRLPHQRVDRLGQRDVARRQAAGVVRRQQHVDTVVDVRPFGMMVGLFSEDRDARHEPERLDEIGEREGPGQRVARLVIVPVAKPIERARAFGLGQLLDHLLRSPSVVAYVAAMVPPGQTLRARETIAPC